MSNAIRKYPKYEIGDEVYAIAYSNEGNNNIWENNFAKIFRVKIKAIYIDSKYINYFLVGEDGVEWSEEVNESDISRRVHDLIDRLRTVWNI